MRVQSWGGCFHENNMNLRVVEDAAQAFGIRNNKMVGLEGTSYVLVLMVLKYYCGEGGALLQMI